MKEVFSLLKDRERQRIRLLVLLLLVGAVFLLVVSSVQRRGFVRLQDRLQARQQVLAELEAKRTASAEEWAMWQASYRDIEELKKTCFYRGKEDLNQLRLDLEKILAEAGVSAKYLKYDYSNPGKNKIEKVNISFTFVGSYIILRRFLEVVERFPRFLMLEKVDFARVSAEGSVLELRIVLAGYYENP